MGDEQPPIVSYDSVLEVYAPGALTQRGGCSQDTSRKFILYYDVKKLEKGYSGKER